MSHLERLVKMHMPRLLPGPAGVKKFEEVLLYNPDYSFTEPLCIENPACDRHCSGHWGYRTERGHGPVHMELTWSASGVTDNELASTEVSAQILPGGNKC